jgi:hypothetical protein
MIHPQMNNLFSKLTVDLQDQKVGDVYTAISCSFLVIRVGSPSKYY